MNIAHIRRVGTLKLLLLMTAILLSALLPGGMSAQVVNYNIPDCIKPFQFVVTANIISPIKDVNNIPLAAGSSTPFDNRYGSTAAQGSCNLWHLMYWVAGTGGSTISTVSLQVDQAPDTGSNPGSFTIWPAANVLGTLPITTLSGVNTTVSMYGFTPWARVFLNSATGTGLVQGVLFGWRPQGTSDTTSGATPVNPATFTYKNITTLASTVVKTGSGSLHAIILNTTAAGTVTIFDNSACSGTKIATLATFATAAPVQPPQVYDVTFNTGLCVQTSVAEDITVSFK